MEVIKITSSKRSELIDITTHIEKIVSRSNIGTGMCTVFIPHTTAGVMINENYDPSVKEDIVNELNSIIPVSSGNYTHSEGNSDAHIKSGLVGANLSVFIHRNKVVLGKWQGIFFAEFDGPREREIFVNLLEQK